MIKLIAIAALGLSVAGCVTNSYPQTAEAQRMLKVCQYDANKAMASARYDSIGDGVVNGIERGGLIRQCMELNGVKAL